MNRQEMRNKLDHSAGQLDGKGYRDLADKVDECNEKLMKASKRGEVNQIRSALIRVNREAARRDEIDYTKPEEKTSRLEQFRQLRKARKEQKKLDERKTARKEALERLKKRREAKKEGGKKIPSSLRLARLKRQRAKRNEKIWDDE